MLNFDWVLASISTILTLDCIEYMERKRGTRCDVGDLKCGFCRFTAGDVERNLGMENRGEAMEVGDAQSDREEMIRENERDHSREREMISENEALERERENRTETRPDAEERISLELGIGESLLEIADDADASALAIADTVATPPCPPKATPPRHPKAHAKGKARQQPPAKAKAMPSQPSPAAKATAKLIASLPPPKARASASTAETDTRWFIPKANATEGAEVVEEDVVAQGAVVIDIVIAIVTTIIP